MLACNLGQSKHSPRGPSTYVSFSRCVSVILSLCSLEGSVQLLSFSSPSTSSAASMALRTYYHNSLWVCRMQVRQQGVCSLV